jgi:hypothetical protein
LLRREWSIARRLAVAISHAPGLSGCPIRATARERRSEPLVRGLRRDRHRAPCPRGRQSAWPIRFSRPRPMVRCVSITVTATDHTIFTLTAQVAQAPASCAACSSSSVCPATTAF